MRLLIITQKVDRDDPILGFFHGWIVGLTKHFESLTVICLEKGAHELPDNVKVMSLGKERRKNGKMEYTLNFYKYIWQEKNNYDAVFVHMNQEYVLLGGWLWRLLSKKIYMWRNHKRGSILTDIAMIFCTKIFCTSRSSYTAKSTKTIIMPVGIDTDTFKPDQIIQRKSRSILFLSRMAPIKRPDLLIEALDILNRRGARFSADLYGDPLPKDREYYESLKRSVIRKDLSGSVWFHPGVANRQTPALYSSHEIFVNLTESGAYDKTILEAMACACIPFVTNGDLKGHIPEACIVETDDSSECAHRLESLLNTARTYEVSAFRDYVVENHSLAILTEKIASVLHGRG